MKLARSESNLTATRESGHSNVFEEFVFLQILQCAPSKGLPF